MDESPLIKYIARPVHDSFPTQCSSAPIPEQGFGYPYASIAGDHVRKPKVPLQAIVSKSCFGHLS